MGPRSARAQRFRGNEGDGEPCAVGHEVKTGTKRQARVDGVGLGTPEGRAGRVREERGPRGQPDG